MPQIDLPPDKYRAPPEPGQPFFKPGGKWVLLGIVGFMVLGVALTMIVSPFTRAFFTWLRGQ